ncbi:MAG: porin family protein [Alphaproteobacteria bacterium]|nr:porin family protein [Alphaproteobacteria bacterium]
MKKTKLFLLSLLVGTTSSYATLPFNGFYLGAQAGYTQRAIKTDLDASGAIQSTYAHRKRSNGFLYGLMAGYGQNMKGVYLGVEVSLQDDTASRAHQSHTISVTNTTTGAVSQVNVQTRYERDFVLGLAPRIGAVLGQDNLLYIKLGLETSRDYMSHKADNTNGWHSPKTRKTVFVPGIGYEKAFGNTLVRAEYGYNCGANLSSTRTESIAGMTSSVTQKAKYQAHEFKVGVSYQF